MHYSHFEHAIPEHPAPAYSPALRESKNLTRTGEVLVGEGGFEPPKASPADLQSVPFGHSGIPPFELDGAGGRTRTPDLLITNQLLYRLSYTSMLRNHSHHPAAGI